MRSILALALLSGCASGRAPSPAPDPEVRTLDGKALQISALWSERPVLLVFMTAWCMPCREEVPRLNEVSRRHPVVAISTGDRPEAVERVRRETGMTYPVYLDDGRAARAYGIVSSPTCILVDREGVIRHRGAHPPEGL